MGVKNLWSVLSPHSEPKPLSELRGKIVAIDLAGWVCESLNVVDYYVHPRNHLKNLFFRTSCLLLEGVTPIFVLEGTAPNLKKDVITKRNEIQFRGRPQKQKKTTTTDHADADEKASQANKKNTRQRFNFVLKQCENLLKTMGINCIQAPGEAEAFCAFLNKKKLVDGVISQDSDCFAYGATRVYRNFCMTTKGAANQGASVDIYDMEQIQKSLDIGQNKIIAMALLCGCDYCPAGVDGVGRDNVLKIFRKYNDNEILNKLRAWRKDSEIYKTLELRVDDKNVCKTCGHLGSLQSHLKSGCSSCRTNRNCDGTHWKEERLVIKAELLLRKKALDDPNFPREDIIQEFLNEPATVPAIDATWKQPNILKFIKQIGPLLQWTENYSFEKIFPVFTRWKIRNDAYSPSISQDSYITPLKIIKKRMFKKILSVEILWKDQKESFRGIVVEQQIDKDGMDQDLKNNDVNKLITVEPFSLVEAAYPKLLEAFLSQNPKGPKKATKTIKEKPPLGALENFKDLVEETNKIATETKTKKSQTRRRVATKNMQKIDKYFYSKDDENIAPVMVNDIIQPFNTVNKFDLISIQSSTPITKSLPFELDSENENENDSMNVSAVINDIIKRPVQRDLSQYTGRALKYELAVNISRDDLDLFETEKRKRLGLKQSATAKFSLDDSFDVLMKIRKDCHGHFSPWTIKLKK